MSMAEKKEDNGFFENLQHDFRKGVDDLTISLDNGLNNSRAHLVLLAKYTVFTLIVAFVYAALIVILPDMAQYLTYTLFIPLAVLILLFHHELFSVPVKDINRFAFNSLALAIFFILIYLPLSYTLSHQTPEGEPQSPLTIISSTIAIFIFVIFLFIPIYLVKAGASPLGAVRNTFKFMTKNAIKGMFYVVMLLMLLSVLSSLPSLVGVVMLSPVLFVFLSYCVFVFAGSFWERCRNG